jgi:hypothetical protein
VRAATSRVDAVDNVLAATANPENPSEVDVSQPSAALVAQADVQGAFDDLLYASSKSEAIVIPALAWADGIGAAILIGAIAGLWPALRASRMSPTETLWTV